MIFRTLIGLSTAAALCTSHFALADDKKKTSVTIYSKATPGAINPDMYRPVPGGHSGWGYQQIPGYAMVRQSMSVNLPKKRNVLEFTDVAALLEPTTVSFQSLTDPKTTSVLEQSYLFDIVNQQKLLEKFVNQEITVEQANGSKIQSYTGILLNASGGITLESKKGDILSLRNYSNIRFPKLPGGLITTPTLKWDIATKRPGTHVVEAMYQTAGITWWADYNGTYTDGEDANNGTLDLSAWVSILNKSGATYKDATLKLVAGDVNKIQPQQNHYAKRGMMLESASMDMAQAPGFAQKAFFEFHLYTLGRPITIADNATKQVELFPAAASIPVEKKMVYRGTNQPYYGGVNTNRNYGTQSNTNVEVFLNFENSEEAGLGIPIPAGRMRISKRDMNDGAVEFIGEDIVKHTPRDEDVKLKLGNAFDVKGARKQTSYFVDNARKILEESFEITVKNHKDEMVKVDIVESLSRASNWQMLNHSDAYEKDNAFTIHFPVEVPSRGQKTVTYKVKYTW